MLLKLQMPPSATTVSKTVDMHHRLYLNQVLIAESQNGQRMPSHIVSIVISVTQYAHLTC